MADVANLWEARGSWAGVASAPAHIGVEGAAGVTVTLVEGLGVATLIAGADIGPLAAAIQKQTGLKLPATPAREASGAHAIVWTAPGQWLLVSDNREGFTDLLRSLSGVAAISDQSASRAVHRISGPDVREILSRGFMLDLHDKVFPVGAAASTSVAHVGVQIVRLPDAGGSAVFEIMVPRSYAGSYWSWLSASAATVGCRIEAQAA